VPLAPEPPPDVEGPRLRRPSPPVTWRDRVERLADASGTTPARIVGGGALAATALLGGLWLTRPPAAPPEVSLPFAPTSSVPDLTSSTSLDVVLVHVAGAVVVPGVHELEPGARVIDAIQAAGGLAPEADSGRINLAAPVADGERVYVPAVGEPAPTAAPGGSPPGAGSTDGPVDLNQADEAALDALPGVGPTTASAIVEHRARIGRFTSVDQLLDVRGIGEAKLEQLRPLVTV
jgi:competence protein ComEA